MPVPPAINTARSQPFLPYTEFAKFPAQLPSRAHVVTQARALLRRHLGRMPVSNPVAAFAREFPMQVSAIADRPFGFFHKYAFNTLRQLGANFELAASHFRWLSEDGEFEQAAEALKGHGDAAHAELLQQMKDGGMTEEMMAEKMQSVAHEA